MEKITNDMGIRISPLIYSGTLELTIEMNFERTKKTVLTAMNSKQNIQVWKMDQDVAFLIKGIVNRLM